MLMQIITSLVSADKVGGYVRAFTASVLGAWLVKNPTLAQYLSPEVQIAIGVLVTAGAVGAWSHFAKFVKDEGL